MVSLRFFNTETTVIIMTTKLVTLIPPPVEPGAAPINIRRMESIFDMEVMPSMLMELNPAVRVVADWKNALLILVPTSIFAIVRGLFHSNTKKKMVPTTIKKKSGNQYNLGVKNQMPAFTEHDHIVPDNKP